MNLHLCKICLSIVKNPVSCNKCEDLFCSLCIKKSLQIKKECPNCREILVEPKEINRMVKRIIDEMKINCPFDCEKIFPLQSLEKHLKNESEFYPKTLICKLCDKKILIEKNEKKETNLHNLQCENLIVKCYYCWVKLYR